MGIVSYSDIKLSKKLQVAIVFQHQFVCVCVCLFLRFFGGDSQPRRNSAFSALLPGDEVHSIFETISGISDAHHEARGASIGPNVVLLLMWSAIS